tara:strand:+ start:1250 stop:2278 length:1029 start_codon:yes stop_codon:yes gene_type:complete
MDKKTMSNQDEDINLYSKFDLALRPKKLADFIGQKKVQDNLSTFIKAASVRDEPMDHILLHGPPGLGKTTLAHIVSSELNVNIRTTSGPILNKTGDLAAILTNLQPKDILFIDEIHRLSSVIEEYLYSAMEDFQIDLIIGEGPGARSIRIDVPPFTLIGATTRAGLLTTPLRDRFGIQIRMEFYNNNDLKHILKQSAFKLELDLTDEGAIVIAERSRGTPRVAGRLLRRIRDISSVKNIKSIDKNFAIESLEQLDVDKFGLDALDRKYMQIIIEKYEGGPVGLETIAAVLSEQKDLIEEVIEPFLLQKGFIERSKRGRIITKIGWKHLGIEQNKKNLDQFNF